MGWSPWRTVMTKSGPVKIMISPVSTTSLAWSDRFVFDVFHGAQDQELDVVVHLEFGSLVGVDGVLDGQFVQAEQPPTSCICLASGACSPSQTNRCGLCGPSERALV